MSTGVDTNTFYRTDTAKSRYDKLVSDRKVYVDRAVKNAKITIPMLFPDENATSTTEYETPYQSIGARGVNNLAAKIMLALFPPNEPFFKLELGDMAKQQVAQQGDTSAMTKIDKLMGAIERQLMDYMETNRCRITISEGVLQLIVAGNCLLYLPPQTGGIKLYRLNNYVVVRDGTGNWIELIAKDSISYAALPPEAQSCVEGTDVSPDKNVELYTHVYLADGETFEMYQEIEGQIIKGSEQEFPRDKVPWIPLRLRKMDGESYGRSYVDEYYGDLKSLNSISKSIAEMATLSAFALFLVNPSSQLRVDKLKDAQSGDFFKGKEGDITAFQLNKVSDLQVAYQHKQELQSNLSFAFLLNSSVQRNAERVTAEEIRYVANELEDSVGNIYSLLSLELQLPLVQCLMAQLMAQGALPDIPQGSDGVQTHIVTGMEALGRGHDLTKIEQFLQTCSVLPDFQQRLKTGNVLSQIGTALGLDADSLVMSDEEYQAMQAQMMQAQMAQQMASPIAQGMMNNNNQQ